MSKYDINKNEFQTNVASQDGLACNYSLRNIRTLQHIVKHFTMVFFASFHPIFNCLQLYIETRKGFRR
jgi:hypothetical protein